MVMCYVVCHIAGNCIHMQMNGIVCVILMSFLASTSVFTLLSHGRFASASFFCVFVYFRLSRVLCAVDLYEVFKSRACVTITEISSNARHLDLMKSRRCFPSSPADELRPPRVVTSRPETDSHCLQQQDNWSTTARLLACFVTSLLFTGDVLSIRWHDCAWHFPRTHTRIFPSEHFPSSHGKTSGAACRRWKEGRKMCMFLFHTLVFARCPCSVPIAFLLPS